MAFILYGFCSIPLCSPKLFIIYITPFSEVIWKFRVKCHQQIDDTQLYFSFLLDPGEAIEFPNQCLAVIMGCMSNLKFSPFKKDVLLVDDLSLQVSGVQPVLDGITTIKDEIQGRFHLIAEGWQKVLNKYAITSVIQNIVLLFSHGPTVAKD